MATKKKAEAENKNIVIPAINIQVFDLNIVGDSPFICHAWSEKAKIMMLQKQQKKATAGKEIRNPMREYADSLYWLSEKPNFDDMTEDEIFEATQKGKFGFPTLAFKAAAIDAGYQSGVLDKKTTARGAFHILGDFAEINGKPSIREDMTRIGMGTADLRYRAEFKEWSTTLKIKLNTGAMSMEQVINLMNIGGFACGIGDWRVAKDGVFGMFHVE
jgi:hypothetical protein